MLENPDGTSGFTQVATIPADATTYDHAVFLPARVNASYMLRSCNGAGCADSATVPVGGTLASAAGYVKASNTETATSLAEEGFGFSIALSADGNTLAVGAPAEDGGASGINGNEADNTAFHSGAVHVYTRTNNAWTKQAYIKASNPTGEDHFGERLALSGDGNTLAVASAGPGVGEDGNATGINGNQSNNSASASGAVYLY